MNILILAQNAAKAKEGQAILEAAGHKKISLVFPGSKIMPKTFDALVVFHHNKNEVNLLKDTIARYENAPVKVFLGKDEKHDQDKAFASSDASGAIAYITKTVGELEEMMKKTFESFDKDKSGSIDIKELEIVSKELNQPMTAAQLEECMKDLDVNND